MAEPVSRKSSEILGRVGGFALLLAVFAVLVSLGTWQMQRLTWKQDLLAAIAERTVAPPASLAEIEALARDGGDIEYRTITLDGTYIHSGERHFFATHQGRTGYYVYTPLALTDGRAVFVNRGFVPFDSKEPATRAQGQLPGPQTVRGLVRAKLAGKPSWVVPDNDPVKNIFYWKDIGTMASSAGLDPARTVPFFVDADATPNPGGLPIGGVTRFDFPNSHLQYALTWYGLAAALLVVSGVFVFRRGRL